MQKYLYLSVIPLMAGFFLLSCSSSGNRPDPVMADSSRYTTIQWLDSVVNFGSIRKGETIKVAFRFRNTGKYPLLITNVRAGCGCTVPEYTQQPVAPGAEGLITGAFDSNKAQAGEVRKSIFVSANTSNKSSHTLIFTGLVKETAE